MFHPRRPYFAGSCRALAVSLTLAVAFGATSAHAASINGGLALTSDCVWFGFSQSNDSAAVQASF
jgi:hypothetical protein